MAITKVDLYVNCSRTKKNGGWAAILVCKDKVNKIHERTLSDYVVDSTANRLVMIAMITGLQTLKWACDVTIYTDIGMMVAAVGTWNDGRSCYKESGWMVDWQRRNWQRKEGELLNSDLWRSLHLEICKHRMVTVNPITNNYNRKSTTTELQYNQQCIKLAKEIKNNAIHMAGRNGLPTS